MAIYLDDLTVEEQLSAVTFILSSIALNAVSERPQTKEVLIAAIKQVFRFVTEQIETINGGEEPCIEKSQCTK